VDELLTSIYKLYFIEITDLASNPNFSPKPNYAQSC